MNRLLRLLRLHGLVLVSIAGAGCAQSANPLSDEKTSVVDERVLGAWEHADKGQGTAKYTVERKEGAKNTLQVMVEDKPGAEPRPLVAFTTKIDTDHYISLGGESPGEPLRYIFMRYEVLEEGKTLRVYSTNNEPLNKAVASKELKGYIKKQEIGSYPVLEDTTDTLVAFYSKHREQLAADTQHLDLKKVK